MDARKHVYITTWESNFGAQKLYRRFGFTEIGKIPEYASALEAAMGPDGPQQLARDVEANMATFNAAAERVYINWLQAAAQA